MYRRSIFIFTMCFALLALSNITYAQSDSGDLNIFGFSQVLLNSRHYDITLFESSSIPVRINKEMNANSFALHQVNLFFQKIINEKTTFFLSIEATGSYSSKIPSGYIEIPEGWISFKLKDNMELKTGLLLPRYNNLNEIQNRLPLFPYLIRPIVYETFFANIQEAEDYKPKNAYLQLTGYTSISKNFDFDYAFFIGNAEDSFLSAIPAGSLGEEEESTALYQGENLNTQLLYGFRIGIENYLKTVKIGTSFTFDEEDRTDVSSSSYVIEELTVPVLGEIPRYRFGFDASFTHKQWASETELMTAFHDHRNIHKVDAFKNANLNKYFFFTNLTYNISSKAYMFSSFTYITDNTTVFVANDPPNELFAYSFGGGWRINDVTVFKLQTIYSHPGSNSYVDYDLRFITVGVSTIF